jgi:hypothetical protein
MSDQDKPLSDDTRVIRIPEPRPMAHRFDPGTAPVSWDRPPAMDPHERRPYPAGGQTERPWYPPGPPPALVTYAAPAVPSSTVSVWALVLGIVGVFGGWCLFGLPNIAAIVLGHVGLSDTKDGRKSGRGMAITGLVTGYVMVLPAIILFFYMVIGAGMGAATPSPSPSF